MALDLTVIAVLCASIAAGLYWLRRPGNGATAFWVLGWVAAGAGGVLLLLQTELPRARLLSYPLGTLFASLLLAGALAFADRRVPRWLLPSALGFGALRAALAASGRTTLAYGLAAAIEPALVLTAAVILFRTMRDPRASTIQRLLAPAFGLLAAGSLLHLLALMPGEEIGAGLSVFWFAVGPAILGLQIHAGGERMRAALHESRTSLAQRVEERTAELARANASLREQVAERGTAEAALRLSEERYRTVSELSSDFSFAFRIDSDLSLRREWITGAFTRITGYEPERLDGHGWLTVLPMEDRQGVRGRFESGAGDGKPVTLEQRILTRSGETRWLEIQLEAVRSASDGTRVVGAARDVTSAKQAEDERRRLEQHVHEAQKLESLGILTGGIAHDFNNLLTVILGNARLAADTLEGETPLRQQLDRIRSAGEQASGLTEQMLTATGRVAITPVPIDLSREIAETRELLRSVIPVGCTLESSLAAGLPGIQGDRSQLRRLILGLTANAGEAMSSKPGTVWIRTGTMRATASFLADTHGTPSPPEGDYVYMEVADTGEGMDGATRARIFEPFFTTRFPGRGLGLATALGIVRAHGGVFKISSEVDRGTSVRVLLPRAASGGVPLAPASRLVPRGPGGRILVVDDEDWVLELTREFLERSGYQVLTASGGREALDCFRERADEIDAVVLDLAMPDIDGERVLMEMRRLRDDVPVILATGYDPEWTASRLGATAFAGLLRKPYEPEVLIRRLREALGE
jgi:PAS domain S-box-containing protein